MNNPDVEEAIKNVRELKLRIIDHQLFKGFSGTARILSGVAALLAAIVMANAAYPKTVTHILAGWGVLCTLAVFLNAGAMLGRFLSTRQGLTDWTRLRPILNILPPFLLAAFLSLQFVLHDMHASLYGMWMGMFGLMHLAARHTLPQANAYIGWFFLGAGMYFLLHPPLFTNPWPMGVVFFIGEVVGGIIFCRRENTEG
jgi:hypothetical protein